MVIFSNTIEVVGTRNLTITRLIWDDWNAAHIARHNLVPGEVEQALTDPDLIGLPAKHGRIMALGQTGQRLVAIILSPQAQDGVYYVVTAYDMGKKQRALYHTLKAQQRKGADNDA